MAWRGVTWPGVAQTDLGASVCLPPSRAQVLTKVGVAHFGLSAGLVVGGKDFAEERARVTTMNILVATPGRLVQVRRVGRW